MLRASSSCRAAAAGRALPYRPGAAIRAPLYERRLGGDAALLYGPLCGDAAFAIISVGSSGYCKLVPNLLEAELNVSCVALAIQQRVRTA